MESADESESSDGYGSSYAMLPYDSEDRSKCADAVYQAIFGSPFLSKWNCDVLDSFFAPGVVMYVVDGDGTPSVVRIRPYPLQFVQLYFSRNDKGELKFDGGLYPKSPNVTIAIGCSSLNYDSDRFMIMPVDALGTAPDLYNAVLNSAVPIRWQPGECFLFFCAEPNIKCKRVSDEELLLAIRRRLGLYRQIDSNDGETITREQLDAACSVATERQAVLDWLAAFILGMCFALHYDYFHWNESILFQLRLELQADTPQARMCALVCNGFSQTFAEACRTDDADFEGWARAQHNKMLEQWRITVSAMVRLEDPVACHETMERIMSKAVDEIQKCMQ